MSGEALASAASDETLDAATVERMAKEMVIAMDGGGLELAVVVGGGNIWRGTTGESGGMDRAPSDTMGMLGTVINALALQDALEQQGQPTRVLSALSMAEVAEPYIRRRAIRHLEKGRIVVFAAGMGNPFFTTDTPAALRAAEIGAELLCKGTHSGVDGVYSADPKLDPSATRYEEISFMEVINKDLRVMDLTAITFCKDNDLPIRVFDLMVPGNIPRALKRSVRWSADGRRPRRPDQGRHQGQDGQGHRPRPPRNEQRPYRAGLLGPARAAHGRLLRDADPTAPAGRVQRA